MARKPTRKELQALDRAQEVLCGAWEGGRKRRADLAQRALAISPLCADAHVILAMDAPSGSDAKLEHWRRGVQAGEAALGKSGFEEFAGMFWGFLETRPYMRARLGLAEALWERGEREDGVAHLEAMLALNPGDNQGVRYILAAHLLELDRLDALDALLQRYHEDECAVFTYCAALAAFKRFGDGEASQRALQKAIALNKHVPAFLTGARPIPERAPAYYGLGDENEAIMVAQDYAGAWFATPGACAWLAAHAPPPAQKRSRKRTAK